MIAIASKAFNLPAKRAHRLLTRRDYQRADSWDPAQYFAEYWK
jgi:hypothetical protein